MTCPGQEVCLAVGATTSGGGDVVESLDGGSAWTVVGTASYPLYAVSSASESYCVAVGGSGGWGGQGTTGVILTQSSLDATFSAVSVPSGVGALQGIDCPTTSGCYATGEDASTGYDDDIAEGNLSSWSLATSVTISGDNYLLLFGMQCTSSTTCITDGQSYYGPVFASTSNSWSSYSAHYNNPVPQSFQQGISCADATFCLGVGLAYFYSGPVGVLSTNWSSDETANPASSSGRMEAYGVICVSDSVCGMVGTSVPYPDSDPPNESPGVIYTTTNANSSSPNWNSDSVPSVTEQLYGITCSSGVTCLAVGEDSSSQALVLIDDGDALTPPDDGPSDTPSNPKTFTGGHNNASPGSTCRCSSSPGEPVDAATGDYYTSDTDLAIPTYGPALSFTRTYDSLSAQSETTPGPLGYGWTDNYSAHLLFNDPAAGDVTVVQDDGAQSTFFPPVDNSCVAPYEGPGTSGTYCVPPDVTASLMYSSATSTYSLTYHPYEQWSFNSSGQLTAITDADGESVTIGYNTPAPGTGACPSSAGSCLTVTAASGRALTIGWSGSGDSGEITSVTDPLGRSYNYAYDPTYHNLTSVTDPRGEVTSYIYDTSNSNANLRHDLTEVVSPNAETGGPDAGDDLVTTYDSVGRVLTQTDPMGHETQFNYTSMAGPGGNGDGTVVVTDPDGFETAYQFNANVLVDKTVGYGGSSPSTTSYTINSSTQLTEGIIDGDGNGTSYTYDPYGNVTTVTDPLGNVSSASFNSFDEPVCSAHPEQPSPCSSLSPPAAIPAGTTTITPPSSAPPLGVTYREYDSDGNLIWTSTGVYAPNGATLNATRTSYFLYAGEHVTLSGVQDSCGATPPSTSLPCVSIDPDGVVTQLAYDSGGDLTSSSTPDGNAGGELSTTTYTYDADGERTSVTSPDGNLSGANAANYTTTFTYNADGQLTQSTQGAGNGATVVPRTITLGYDADGNETTRTESYSASYVAATTASSSSSSSAQPQLAGGNPSR